MVSCARIDPQPDARADRSSDDRQRLRSSGRRMGDQSGPSSRWTCERDMLVRAMHLRSNSFSCGSPNGMGMLSKDYLSASQLYAWPLSVGSTINPRCVASKAGIDPNAASLRGGTRRKSLFPLRRGPCRWTCIRRRSKLQQYFWATGLSRSGEDTERSLSWLWARNSTPNLDASARPMRTPIAEKEYDREWRATTPNPRSPGLCSGDPCNWLSFRRLPQESAHPVCWAEAEPRRSDADRHT